MPDKKRFDLDRLAGDLAHGDAAVVQRAVGRLGARLGRMRNVDYRRAVEALCSLFYVDIADRPDLEAALERVMKLLTAQRARVVPLLLSQMRSSDIKSHLYLARTLGRIGRDALPRLRDLLAKSEDPYARAFALYAIGKMTGADVVRVLPEVLGGLMHPDKEVRDSAARTIGRIVATVPARRLPRGRRREIFDVLLRTSRDLEPPVRAKAIRSLGKMAAAGLLDSPQREVLAAAARSILGETEDFTWDNAYIVRREARETLQHLRS